MPHEVLTLRDSQADSTVRILPGFGFNCFSFQVPAGGETVDLLWAEEGFEQGDKRASGSGIPILFPFPGRLLGTSFSWEDRTYEFEPGDGRGNAIHGIVHTRPWRVVEQSERHVVGQFQASLDAADLGPCWPADFRLTATYRLDGTRLQTSFQVENPDQVILPWGLGLHPYFRLPLGRGAPDGCLVQLPVTRRWVLQEMLPTGDIEEVPEAEKYQQGLRFGDMQFDDVFTSLRAESGQVTASILDPQHGRTVQLRFDAAFRECVVYTPNHREAVCIEPYSCLPGAVQLESRGIDAGLQRLAPGKSFRLAMEIALHGE